MNELFSIRYNLINSMKDNGYSIELRNAVVNSFLNQYNSFEEGDLLYRMKEVMDLFGIEQEPHLNDKATLVYNKKTLQNFIQTCKWNKLFDFVEYALAIDENRAEKLAEKYNLIFKMNGCRYRVLNGSVIPVADELELEEMNRATITGIESVDSAYSEAVKLLSEKPIPDFNAVIAKASNALEAMVIDIAKDYNSTKNVLGKAISTMKKHGAEIDSNFEMLLTKIYAYASKSGIRHGGNNPVQASEEDAVFVMVICAALINYMNSTMRSHSAL